MASSNFRVIVSVQRSLGEILGSFDDAPIVQVREERIGRRDTLENVLYSSLRDGCRLILCFVFMRRTSMMDTCCCFCRTE